MIQWFSRHRQCETFVLKKSVTPVLIRTAGLLNRSTALLSRSTVLLNSLLFGFHLLSVPSDHFLDGNPGPLLDLLEGFLCGVLQLSGFELRPPPTVCDSPLVRSRLGQRVVEREGLRQEGGGRLVR